MAANFVNSSTFEGAQRYDFYAAILDSEFASRKDWVNVSSVKNDVLLPSLSTSGMLTPGEVCDFTDTGTATVSRKSVGVCPWYVNYQLCKKDIEATFLSERMRAGQNTGEASPAEFTDFLVKYIKDGVLVDLETNTWVGSTQSAGCYGGIITAALLDNTVVTVTGTTSSTTNVIAEIVSVIAATPAKVKRKSNYVIYVSSNIAANLKLALAALVGPYFGYSNEQPLSYAGYTIKETIGLPDNRMFATHLDNLFNVNDLGSDEQTLSVIDMSIVGEAKARMVMAFKYTAAYGVGAECVYYRQ